MKLAILEGLVLACSLAGGAYTGTKIVLDHKTQIMQRVEFLEQQCNAKGGVLVEYQGDLLCASASRYHQPRSLSDPQH